MHASLLSLPKDFFLEILKVINNACPCRDYMSTYGLFLSNSLMIFSLISDDFFKGEADLKKFEEKKKLGGKNCVNMPDRDVYVIRTGKFKQGW